MMDSDDKNFTNTQVSPYTTSPLKQTHPPRPHRELEIPIAPATSPGQKTRNSQRKNHRQRSRHDPVKSTETNRVQSRAVHFDPILSQNLNSQQDEKKKPPDSLQSSIDIPKSKFTKSPRVCSKTTIRASRLLQITCRPTVPHKRPRQTSVDESTSSVHCRHPLHRHRPEI
jgi:hypothetical protein